MLYKVNKYFIVEIPAKGGQLVEGSIGSPRFINPLLSISNADRDLTILVYSGLLRATPDGQLINDLAKEYTISEDGLVYDFILKDDIFFHDGNPITTDDVEFTLKSSQDNVIKSPKRANWDGVGVEKINDKQIRFTLKSPYSPFLENTTLGILPKHIWGGIEPEQFAFSQFNVEPIGSGPYKIESLKRNSSGILEKYELVPFKKYILGEPYISKLTINFYPNEEELLNAYNKGYVESINTISPEKAKELETKVVRIETIPLPRIFGVFFNQNKNSVFTHIEVRQALDRALDKDKIVDEVLNGYGIAIDGPIPPASKFFDEISDDENTKTAIEILENNGWKLNEEGIMEKKFNKTVTPLIFKIATSNAPELKAVANLVKRQWEEIGAKVTLDIFEIGDLNQNVIRPREYDALLFGEIIGRDMDLFAFWHSSQRNDPGLNISLYANITVDKLLEEVRSIHDEEIKVEKYKKFQSEIRDDLPAIFIYSPEFIYILPEKIKNFSLGQITMPSERFLDIYNWNIKTDKVWKIFSKKEID
ncbi:ABC transporter substrate-binding protein [Candidatus Parcubacteria bacterium]|nr:ABC transporter substrate-binding protein [Candidatus Parcubacteria bacterium]